LNKILAPIRQNVLQPESSLFDNQRVPLNNDNTLVGQTVQNQQRLPMFNSESSTDLNKGQLQNKYLLFNDWISYFE
jgi:hypothetical protein